MASVSRRKFLKDLSASLAALACFSIFRTPKKVMLSVDKDGNATLIGAEMTVDEQAKATLK